MNRLAIALPLALALVACNSDTANGGEGVVGDGGTATDGGAGDGGGAPDGGAGDGGAGDGGQGCEVEVDGTVPEDGADGFGWRDEVSFTLSAEDASATISVVDGESNDIAGTVWWDDDGTTITFTPTDGFTADSQHTATLSYCGGEELVAFTTSELGEPLDDVSVLVGKVYALDLANGRWLAPEGVGELIAGGVDGYVLVEVLAADETLRTMGALSETGSVDQDACLPSTDYPDADFSSAPYFVIGPQDVAMEMSGYEVTITDFELSGTFAADASRIGDAEVEGQVDIRNLADLIGETLGTTDPTTICGYLVWLGAECQTCTSDGESYCLGVHIDQIDADETGGDLDVIEQADCHPDCAASYSNAACDTSGW